MQINTTDYNVKTETLFNGTIKYVCVPKERKCDNDRCKKVVRYDKLNLVKFATVKEKTRYNIDAMVCDSCYPEVKEMIDNNPNRRRM
tara:strand:- start:258 stop:518 length:261 start_codon:yes stop_codon:yes gene_type:complete